MSSGHHSKQHPQPGHESLALVEGEAFGFVLQPCECLPDLAPRIGRTQRGDAGLFRICSAAHCPGHGRGQPGAQHVHEHREAGPAAQQCIGERAGPRGWLVGPCRQHSVLRRQQPARRGAAQDQQGAGRWFLEDIQDGIGRDACQPESEDRWIIGGRLSERWDGGLWWEWDVEPRRPCPACQANSGSTKVTPKASGMTLMTMELVFGNSQATAYIAGHRLAHAGGLIEDSVHGLIFRGERYEPYVYFTDNGVRFHPTILDDLRGAVEELRPTSLVAAILGSDHWIYGIGQEPRPFDFLVPDLPQHPLSAQTEMIPYDLLLQRFRGDLEWQFGLVRFAMTLCSLPIFIIEAPPPVENADLMLRPVSGHFKERMEKFGYPSTSFRYKIWWIFTHATKSICADLGISFIEAPPETRDLNGFLNERYYLDGVHGTDEYGALMAGEVAKAKRSMGLAGT
jgi:hypothetical protein